jgi:hypothetical protein
MYVYQPLSLFRFYSDTYVQPDCISNSLNHMHSTLVDIWTNIETEGIEICIRGSICSFVLFELVCVKGRTVWPDREREREKERSRGIFFCFILFWPGRPSLISATARHHHTKSRQQLTGPNIYIHALYRQRERERGGGI